MKSNSKTAYALRSDLKDMPSLHHSFDGQDFDINKSEVVEYLLTKESVKKFVFDTANQIGAIVFDKETRTWHGSENNNAA